MLPSILRRAPLLAVLLLLPASALAEGGFRDVPYGSAYYDAVNTLAGQGMVRGYPDGTFKPDAPINRAEFAAILTGTKKDERQEAACKGISVFKDIPADAWFSSATCLARTRGFVSGYPDGTFRPGQTIAFTEASAMLLRAILPGQTQEGGSPWHRAFVEGLEQRRAIPASIERLDDPVTRGEMAEMLYRLGWTVTSKESRTYADLEVATRTPPKPAEKPLPEGYSKRSVQTSVGTFSVQVIEADLSKGVTVLTDAGVASDCANGCAALPLKDYIDRLGGYAGIHGTYFCPPDYPNCKDQVNSFIYFVYSAHAGAFINDDKRGYDNAGSLFVFRPGRIEFYADPRSFQLDTNVTGAIASWPTVLIGGQVQPPHRMEDDKQRNQKLTRGGIGNKGNVVYLVFAQGATVQDLGYIMQAMGLENGINIDSGGSSALYIDGYKTGPGRKLPNAVILKK